MPQFTTYEIKITSRSRSLRAAQLIAKNTGLPFARVQDELLTPPFQMPRSLPLSRAAAIKRELENCGCEVELKKVITEVVTAEEVELQEQDTLEQPATDDDSPEITLSSDSFRVIPSHRNRRWLWGMLPLLFIAVMIWWLLPGDDNNDIDEAKRHSAAQQLLLNLDQELNSTDRLLDTEQHITAARGLLLRLQSMLRGIDDPEKQFLLEREFNHQQQRLDNLILLQRLPEYSRRQVEQEINRYRALPQTPLFTDVQRYEPDISLADCFDHELEAFFQGLRFLKIDAELDNSFLNSLQRVETLLPFASGEHATRRWTTLMSRPEIENQRDLARQQWYHNPQLECIDQTRRINFISHATGAGSLNFSSAERDTLVPFTNGTIALPSSWRQAKVQVADTEIPFSSYHLQPRAQTEEYRHPDHAVALLQLLSNGQDEVRFTPTATVFLSTARDDSPFRNALEMAWLVFNLSGRELQPLIIAADGHLGIVPADRMWQYFLARSQQQVPSWTTFFL